MQIIVINDCRDENVLGRQRIRASHLFKAAVTFIGVANELGAAGNIIDALDALDGTPSIVLVNVAPRNGDTKKWSNGSPFGYFWYKQTLVVSTIDGLTLSLVKKLGLTADVRTLDTQKAAERMAHDKFIEESLVPQIAKSQFRSFDFLPRIAAYLFTTHHDIGESVSIAKFPDAPKTIWYIDNFGNCKTTLLREDAQFTEGKTLQTMIGNIPCHDRLSHAPEGKTSMIIGSSGLGKQRFLEIVIQGGNAAEKLKLSVGERIL